ncbi:hypothetical protein BDN72DRAFT_834149 [Pluteus cervinus]|uniref:Uncharacterized protein n=1 Tax=Pluteus cervinus TaxID=181527 RepID=A0ACD3B7I6_9AGAR|nr:hypothetical protein BDN72DRAFT_834149 [Pluteus cervinus]
MKVSPAGLVLPLELEHIILQMALENDMTDAKNLLFVAKYVFDWLIPILYKVVTLCRSLNTYPPLHLPITKLPHYGRYVHHLFIEQASDEVIDRYLEFSGPTLQNLKRVVRLPLTHLDLNFSAAINIHFTPVTLSGFSNITHLDVEDPNIPFLSHFPSLTHLVLGAEDDPTLYKGTLEQHSRLRVLILWEYEERDFPELQQRVIHGVEDARVVHLKYGDRAWKMKAL